MPNNVGNILIEGAQIVFRNFRGREGAYNQEGDRNFAVLLAPELAEQLANDGWNVKQLRPREDAEEGEEGSLYLPVSIKYGRGRPPVVAIITDRGRTNIGEDEIEMLDWADIARLDLVIRPYNYDVNGKTGIKAYVKSLFVTIEEDELERKYSEIDTQ